MEKTTEEYIDKIFIDNVYFEPYKIMFYDEESECFVCKPIKNKFFTCYTAKKIEDINKGIFKYEDYEKLVNDFYSDKKFYIELAKLIDSTPTPQLFYKNINGISEGLENINSIKNLKGYEKEIKKFEKGIRRNKKVLHRILDNNEIERVCEERFHGKIYHAKYKYKRLLEQKETILKYFNNGV